MAAETVNNLKELGSLVFESAVVALCLPELMGRVVLSERLGVIGLKPSEMTIELLGNLMPQIDLTLRMCLPLSNAQSAMAKLTAFIIDWEEPPEKNPTGQWRACEGGEPEFYIEWK